MLAHATQTAPTAPAASPRDYRLVLDDLITHGMTISRLIAEEAEAAIAAPPPASPEAAAAAARVTLDLATAHERVARAVRRTILLVQHLDDPAPGQHRAAARKRIVREVEDAIERKAQRPTDAAGLRAELLDRLDRPEIDADILHRPIPEIIADICRDLGLADTRPGGRPWKRRTPEDIARLCALAAQPPAEPTPEPTDDAERFFRLVATPNTA